MPQSIYRGEMRPGCFSPVSDLTCCFVLSFNCCAGTARQRSSKNNLTTLHQIVHFFVNDFLNHYSYCSHQASRMSLERRFLRSKNPFSTSTRLVCAIIFTYSLDSTIHRHLISFLVLVLFPFVPILPLAAYPIPQPASFLFAVLLTTAFVPTPVTPTTPLAVS